MKNFALRSATGAALAVMAGTPCFAQSTSPTIYAVIDVGVNQTRAGSAAGGQSINRVEDGTGLGLSGSRLGFRGTEDLGGGLSAGFVFESGILVDTGTNAQGGRAWGRQAYVSLAHTSYGELRLGRQYMLSDGTVVHGLPFSGAMVTKTSTVISGVGFSALPVWINNGRGDNVVQYATPAMAGFAAAVQAAPGEGVNDSFYGVMGSYKGGPLAAAASYEWNKSRTTGARTNRVLTVGANYTIGTVKLGASVQHAADLLSTSNGSAGGFNFALPATPSSPSFVATDFDGALASFEVPVGAFTVGGSWLHGRFQNSSHSMALDRPGVGVTYALSKRSFLYTGLSMVVGDLKNYTNQQRIWNAGIRTAF